MKSWIKEHILIPPDTVLKHKNSNNYHSGIKIIDILKILFQVSYLKII
jgi:hypothetical protein